MIRRLTASGLVTALVLAAGCSLSNGVREPGPGAETVPANLDAVARFTNATSLSLTGDGGLVVVDRGEERLVRISSGRSKMSVPLQTRRPSAVDASSGLRLLVADESAGTIDILGLSGNLIRRLRVPADAELEAGGAPSQEFLDDRDGSQTTAGRPSDLAALADGGIVAIEGYLGFLAFWDEAGRLFRTVSEVGGRRFRATGVAASQRHVSVIDGESGRIHVFDHAGTFAKTIGTIERPQALGYHGDTLWVADGSRVWSAEGGTGDARSANAALTAEANAPERANLAQSYSLAGIASETVDLAVTASAFYLLTPRALFRMDR